MADKDEAIEYYWSLKPAKFSRLGRMELCQQSGEEGGQDLTLELYTYKGRAGKRLVLTFRSVRQLRFVPETWAIIPVCLEITSVREYQWERVYYKVVDCEGLDFSFYCEEFAAELAGST